MLIPVGATIDRKTWEITPVYTEGTAEELDALVAALADAGRKTTAKPNND